MKSISLREWLDAHEVSIDELGTEDVADACREALWDSLMEDAISDLLYNERSDIVLDLATELPELNPAEVLKFVEHITKRKDAVDIDDVYEFLEKHDEEYTKYLEANLDNFVDEEWFIEWIKNNYSDMLEDYISPDDYYPIWNYAWEFPAMHNAQYLNQAMDSMGLLFFEIHHTAYVTLATTGMSMMPALYYAYAIHSDLDIDPREIAQDIVSHSVGYYKYVIGEDKLTELAKHIGYSIEKLDEISKKDYEQFNALLNKLSDKVKEEKISKLEAAIIGMGALFRKPDVAGAETH